MMGVEPVSDRETLIQLLRDVEWRSRANRLRHELTLGLSTVLTLLITLKVWDLFSPHTALLTRFAPAACALLLVGYVVWRFRKKGTLDDAAASIDREAGLRDEMKTAFWFINHPRSSEWVERQIQRAAAKARTIDLDRTCPRTIPRTSYVAAATILLFIGLNFVPQAAPAFNPSEKQRPVALSRSELEARLRQSIKTGLQEIAGDLRQAEQTKDLAQAILDSQLDQAAEEMRKLGDQMAAGKGASAEDVLQSFRKASTNSRPGLEALTRDLGDLAQAMDSNDVAAMQEFTEKAAKELERIEGEMLVREEGNDQQTTREIQAPRGDDPAQVQQSGGSLTARSDSMGRGGFGGGQEEGPREGAPTTLEVKLRQEALKGGEEGVRSSRTDADAASRQERSTLDYRNVTSELSAAQKDVLNRHEIPWEYRPLIKSYFQEIRK